VLRTSGERTVRSIVTNDLDRRSPLMSGTGNVYEDMRDRIQDLVIRREQLDSDLDRLNVTRQTVTTRKRKDEICSEMQTLDGKIAFLKNKLRGYSSYSPS
jgi:hypothetical protein